MLGLAALNQNSTFSPLIRENWGGQWEGGREWIPLTCSKGQIFSSLPFNLE